VRAVDRIAGLSAVGKIGVDIRMSDALVIGERLRQNTRVPL
jgi:hypothetical protein